MIVAIHQPNYLPWIGYFYKMMLADCFVLFDNAQFSKGSVINRNKIKGPSGAQFLTVPVRTSQGHLQKINEIEIVMENKWQHKHWVSIESCYNRAPFFKQYRIIFEAIYNRNSWLSLSKLNEYIILILKDALGIKTKIILASELEIDGKVNILTICKNLGASCYLSGDGSQGYLVEEEFIENGILVRYANFKHPAYYPQLFKNFIPNLSIIDLLFNCGSKSLGIIQNAQLS